MARTASWIAITALSLLSCWFAAGIVTQAGAVLMPPADDPSAPQAIAAEAARAAVDWSQRSVIVERNLFHSATLAPPAAGTSEEQALEDTQLPLKLLGTASSTRVEDSWAVIEDIQQHDTKVVHVDDDLRDGATVERIERRRIVLNEGGTLRELSLDEEKDAEAVAKALGKGSGRPEARRGRAARAPSARPERAQVSKQEVQQVVQNPASLFQSARILPKYENGAIVGLEVHDPKPGSLFERAGIQSGELITRVNGMRIDSADDSRKVMTELAQGREWTVQVEGAMGTRTVTLSLPEGQ